jgi:rhamnogalacturonan endolyase
MHSRIKSRIVLIFLGLTAGIGTVLFFNSQSSERVKAALSSPVLQPSLMEKIDRSLVAVRRNTTEVYIGWRLLGTDPSTVGFNLYRSTGGADAVKLNNDPITITTDYLDTAADLAQSNAYFVRPIINGMEQASSNTFTLSPNAPVQQYLSVPIQRPQGGTSQQAPGNTVGQSSYTYNANDASVGDVDGDGTYEIILKWDPTNSRDNASAGLSANVLIDAYKLDGTRLWRIDLGKNIRAGAHYTQFMVYDLDGDGKAEIVCKTADGSVDGVGNVIGDATKDWRSLTIPSDSDLPASSTSDQKFGKILAGPEYLTVFNGQTGAAMSTVNYVPTRYPLDGWGGIGGNGNNDSTGNRSDRFLATIAYLDGVRPSVVMCRGYYGRSVLAAWDWRNGQLTQRWVFDSVNRQNPYSGMGAHAISVADVDNDGKDEIIYHSMVVDDDGMGLFTTGLRHGDALHVTDLDPVRPGLEVFGIHENEGSTIALMTPGSAMYDARTGEIVWSNNPGVDVGRGLCADIDPSFLGEECWGAPGGTRESHTGSVIYTQTPNSTNFAVWWDADLSRELEDGTSITKWDPVTHTTSTVLSAAGAASNNGTKSTPSLTADLLGDWREEVVWRASDNNSLRIYTTTIPATNRLYTLMHNRQYRESIAWQNVGYNQPPHTSFYLGTGMTPPPAPNIITALVPPTLTVPHNLVLEATGPNGAVANYTATAVDLIGTPLPITYSIQPGSVFPIGTTQVTVSTTDVYGTTITGTFNVTVQDMTPPSFVSLSASPNTLRPPNHKMVEVNITAVVSDIVDPAPVTRIISVESNEPVNGEDDGNTAPDWEITGDLTLNLRAERSGVGTGRIYTITVESRDRFGNASTQTVAVSVPLN